jgi:hypothetical protein
MYPQFYLDGNIALQNAVDRYHRQTVRFGIQWLINCSAFFTLWIAGIVFENVFASVFAFLELVVCALTLYFVTDIKDEYS